jgi:hypothetical protein
METATPSGSRTGKPSERIACSAQPGWSSREALASPREQDASMSLSTILLIFAFIAFVLAAIGWGYKKTNLIAIGLALWVLSILITQVHFG